jgi:hypothetical protein
MKSRLFNTLLDLLFEIILWLLGEEDEGSGIPVSVSADRAQTAARSVHAGGNHD